MISDGVLLLLAILLYISDISCFKLINLCRINDGVGMVINIIGLAEIRKLRVKWTVLILTILRHVLFIKQ